MDASSQISVTLKRASEGDRLAAEELLPLIYEELRGLAHGKLARLGRGQTLSTTDLVHDSWLRLVGHGDPGWESRRHFFGAAARAMRNILVEQQRRRTRLKRDAARKEAGADLAAIVTDPPVEDVLGVDDALQVLEETSPRAAQLVSLRFFAGLSMSEAAETLGVSLATAERDWRFARSRLGLVLDAGETSA
jgi:RNA polymerase sigma factor (TIGR02999 family)